MPMNLLWFYGCMSGNLEKKVRVVLQEQECPILIKGDDNPSKSRFDRSPGLFINQKTGTVYAYSSRKDNEKGVRARTLGYIKPNKWNQLSVIFTESHVKIYLNGVLDGFSDAGSQKLLHNKESFYIGGHPNYKGECSVELTIDSVKLYKRELKSYEIQAGVRTAFGSIEPSYFHLSCFDCTYTEAVAKCVANFKLCSSEQLYSGVWQAAHIMGWTDQNYYIFSDRSEEPDVKGMGICCREDN